MQNIETISIDAAAQLLGVSAGKIRRMLESLELAAVRVDKEQRIPVDFIQEDAPLQSLHGTLTVLADAGITGRSAIEWLFAKNEQLDAAPIEMLRAGRKKPVRAAAAMLAL